MERSPVWIWGASGAVGRRLAALLAAERVPPLLLGRSAGRLGALADAIPGARTRVLSAGALLPALDAAARSGAAPRVLVHTVGPFDRTAAEIVDACVSLGIDYVDISNEEASVAGVLATDGAARAAGVRVVTGAGFGVAATECLVLALCADRPPARRVTVAAAPYLETVGPAVTRSALEAVAAGGRRYAGGRLVRDRLGSPVVDVPNPDGTARRMGPVPTGDLHAAQRASGAADVVALSSEMPTSRAVTAALPLAGVLLSRPRLRAAALRAADRLRIAGPSGGEDAAGVSLSYARVEWDDGEVREGWLHLGPSYAFTAGVLADVTHALLDGAPAPGAYTPGVLLGAGLPLAHGGRLVGLEGC